MTAAKVHPASKPAPALSEALAKNEQATEEVKRAADDLAVVHAVLDTKLAHVATDEETQLAIDRTVEIEERLADAAEKLDEVNETLSATTKAAQPAAGAKSG